MRSQFHVCRPSKNTSLRFKNRRVNLGEERQQGCHSQSSRACMHICRKHSRHVSLSISWRWLDQQEQIHMLSINDRAKKLGAFLLITASTRSCTNAVVNMGCGVVVMFRVFGIRETVERDPTKSVRWPAWGAPIGRHQCEHVMRMRLMDDNGYRRKCERVDSMKMHCGTEHALEVPSSGTIIPSRKCGSSKSLLGNEMLSSTDILPRRFNWVWTRLVPWRA